MTCTSVILVAGAYFYFGLTHYNLTADTRTPRESRGMWAHFTFQQWLFSYATTDMWGHGITRFDPRSPVRGYTDAMLSQETGRPKFNRNYRFEYDLDSKANAETFPFNTIALFTGFVLAGVLLLAVPLFHRYGRTFVALAGFLCIYCVFFTYWEPFYFEFWIIPSILVVTLGVLVLNLIVEKISCILPRIVSYPVYIAFVLLVLVVVNHNVSRYVIPYSEKRFVQGVGPDRDRERYELMSSPTMYRNASGPDRRSSIK